MGIMMMMMIVMAADFHWVLLCHMVFQVFTCITLFNLIKSLMWSELFFIIPILPKGKLKHRWLPSWKSDWVGWTVSSQREGYQLSLEPRNSVVFNKECGYWSRHFFDVLLLPAWWGLSQVPYISKPQFPHLYHGGIGPSRGIVVRIKLDGVSTCPTQGSTWECGRDPPFS